MTFCKLLRLVSTFLLSLSNDFQISLPSFLKSLSNLHKVIAVLQLVLKFSIVPCTLDLSYYILAEMAATNETIAAIMSEIIAKATDNYNKYLQCHAICLIDDRELLQSFYFTKHNMTLIALIVRSLEQVCTMGE